MLTHQGEFHIMYEHVSGVEREYGRIYPISNGFMTPIGLFIPCGLVAQKNGGCWRVERIGAANQHGYNLSRQEIEALYQLMRSEELVEGLAMADTRPRPAITYEEEGENES